MRPLSIVRYLFVPLNASSLLSILYFAVALTLGEHGGVVGLPVLLTAVLLFFCYGFALLDHVVEGRSHPLVLSTDVIGTFATRAIGTLVLVAFLYYVTDRLPLGPSAIMAIRLLLVALFPVVVGGTVMTGRFIDALNPVATFGTIARIPAGYGALVLVICALWAAPLWILHESTFSFSTLWRMETFLPTGLFRQIGMHGLLMGLLGHIVGLYLWLATFACIGGTLYEWRWELDIKATEAPEREDERASAEFERERNALADRLYAELRAKPFDSVVASVQKLLAEAAQPLDECRWLYARATKFADQRLANHLARWLLPQLLKRRATGEALAIARQQRAASADFHPQTSAELSQLVELARAAGDRVTARKLLVDFSRHYGGDPLAARLEELQKELQQ